MKKINYDQVKFKIIMIIFGICAISSFSFYNFYSEIIKKKIINTQSIYLIEKIKNELEKCNKKKVKCFNDSLDPADIHNKEKFTTSLKIFIEKKNLLNPYMYYKEPSVIVSTSYEMLSCDNQKHNGIIISNNGIKVKIKVCFTSLISREEEFLIKEIE
jgi:hypothetical protein